LKRKADLYIINRENVQWLIEESTLPFDFDMVVVDELSSFKNHRSKRFRALIKRRPLVKRIVGLTGTPASNGLIDLWAQFKLLDKGARLGRSAPTVMHTSHPTSAMGRSCSATNQPPEPRRGSTGRSRISRSR